jgi:hypothetical protein
MTALHMAELNPACELEDVFDCEEHADDPPSLRHLSSSPQSEEASAASSSISMVAAANLPVIEDTDEPSGSNKLGSRCPMYLGPFDLQLGA